MATEIELKLELSPHLVNQLLHHPLLARSTAEIRTLENVYYDTADQQLAAQKMGLRTRFDGTHWWQTLKRQSEAAEGLHLRDEWECAISGSKLELPELIHTGAESKIISWLVSLTLAPLFTTHFQRHSWNLIDDNSHVEMVLDQGEIIAGNQQSRICEIELELKRGDISALQKIARLLQAGIPLTPSNASKAARGYQLHNNPN